MGGAYQIFALDEGPTALVPPGTDIDGSLIRVDKADPTMVAWGKGTARPRAYETPPRSRARANLENEQSPKTRTLIMAGPGRLSSSRAAARGRSATAVDAGARRGTTDRLGSGATKGHAGGVDGGPATPRLTDSGRPSWLSSAVRSGLGPGDGCWRSPW